MATLRVELLDHTRRIEKGRTSNSKRRTILVLTLLITAAIIYWSTSTILAHGIPAPGYPILHRSSSTTPSNHLIRGWNKAYLDQVEEADRQSKDEMQINRWPNYYLPALLMAGVILGLLVIKALCLALMMIYKFITRKSKSNK